jgi:nicotinate phosphoribosyltransferase
VGRESLDDARARHLSSRGELPQAAQQMSRGEPVIATIHQ